jgi:hypothetical protein
MPPSMQQFSPTMMNTSSDSLMSSSSACFSSSPRNTKMHSSGGGGIKMNLNVMRNPIKFAKRSSTGCSSNRYKTNTITNSSYWSDTNSYQLHHHQQYQPSGMKKSQSTPIRGTFAAQPAGDVLPERDIILRTNPLYEDSGATRRSHARLVDVDNEEEDEDDNSLILDSDSHELNAMMIATTTSAIANNGPAMLLQKPAVVASAYPSNATVSTTTTTRSATSTTACTTAKSFFTESLLDSFTSLCLCRYSKQRSSRPKKMTMATPRRSSAASSSSHRPSAATLHLQQTEGLTINRSRRSHSTGNNCTSRAAAASTEGMSRASGGSSSASVSSSSILGKTTKRVATAAGVPVASKSRRIVYPIARYPGRRLNSPQLIQQRRDFLKNQFTFRPVQVADEQLQQQQHYKNGNSSYKNHCGLSAFSHSHHQHQHYFRTVME